MKRTLVIFCSLFFLVSHYSATTQEYLEPLAIFPVTGRIESWDEASGQALVVQQGEAAQIININNKYIVARMAHQNLVGASWSLELGRVVTWNRSGEIWVWNMVSGDRLLHMDHTDFVEHAQISAREHQILSFGIGNSVKIWNINTGDLLYDLEGNWATWNGDESLLLTWSVWGPGNITIWDLALGEQIFTADFPDGRVTDGTWSPSGDRVLFSEIVSRTVSIVELSTLEIGLTLQHEDVPNGVAWSPDEKLILTWTSDFEVSKLYVWDALSGNLLQSLPFPAGVSTGIWSPDSSRVVAQVGEELYVWDVADGKLDFRLTYGTPSDLPIPSAQFSKDGSRIFQQAGDGTFRVWNANTGNLLAILRHQTSDGQLVTYGVPSAALSTDEQRVITATHSTINVWGLY